MSKKELMSTRMVWCGILSLRPILYLRGVSDAKHGVEEAGMNELVKKVNTRITSEILKLGSFIAQKIVAAYQVKALLSKLQAEIGRGGINEARALGTVSGLIVTLAGYEANVRRNAEISESRRDKVRAKALKKISSYSKGVARVASNALKESDLPETTAEKHLKVQLDAFYAALSETGTQKKEEE